eukprot:TRINITY_DN1729_c0_g3_i1.p1 TRINITY_DN1729_c0_g3~~TRINITY_DN1729_c0_g3_i1.p1  ORF type:complete len:224 (-),score=26.98 TRINITY_DN1729_c0_g3_i1:55-726(-)
MRVFMINVKTKFLELMLRAKSDDDKGESHKDTSYFEEMFTEEGLENLKNWFTEHSLDGSTLEENQFIELIRNLTSFRDAKILELLDIFDKEDTGTIYWDEFFLLVALFAALESKHCTRFFHKYSNRMFEILGGTKTNPLNFERFSRLGFVLGIPEEHVLLTLQELEVEKIRLNNVSFEEFNLYYFTILDKIDRGIDLSAPNSSSQLRRTVSRDKETFSCCMIL